MTFARQLRLPFGAANRYRKRALALFKRQYTPGKAEMSKSIDRWLGSLQGEMLNPDELVGEKGYEIYRAMTIDEVVKASLLFKKYAVISTGWTLNAATDEPRDQEAKDFIEHVFTKMDRTVDDVLLQILDALDMGFSIQELVPVVYEKGPFTSSWGLRAIKDKPQETFTFKLDDFGNIERNGLIQKTAASLGSGTPLPIIRFVHFAYNGKNGNPYGESDLRAAYRSYFSKDVITRFWCMFLEKFAAPTPIGKYPPGTSDTERAQLLTFLTDMHVSGALTIPEDTNVEMFESQRSGKAEYHASVQYFNKMIARAVLLPALIAEEGERSGSYALGEKHVQAFIWVLEALQRRVESVVNEQIIRRVIDWNLVVEDYPTFAFEEFKTEDQEKLAKILFDGVNAGIWGADEPFIRERLGVPPRDEDMPPLEVKPRQVPPKEPEEPVEGPIEKEEEPKDPSADFARLTPHEQKVDFIGMRAELDAIEASMETDLGGIMRSMRDELIVSLRANGVITSKNLSRINQLHLSRVRRFRDRFAQGLARAVLFGAYNARREVEKGLGQKLVLKLEGQLNMALDEIPAAMRAIVTEFKGKTPIPTELLKRYSRKSFTITGVHTDELLGKAKIILTNGIQRGAAVRTMEQELAALFESYLPIDTINPALRTGYRLRNIIRTNISEAFNTGRMNFFREPTVWKEIEAFQYSAIIDDVTTDICVDWHENIVRKNDQRFGQMNPPNHHQCRSLWVPITVSEPFNPMSKGDLDRAPQPAQGFGF